MMSLTFTPGMLGVLRSMRGRVLRSYEYRGFWGRQEAGVLRGMATGEFRLNLGRSAVHVTCALREVDWYSVPEEGSCFACEAVPLKTPYDYLSSPPTEKNLRQLEQLGLKAPADYPTRAYLVDEKVTGVEVVTDHVVFGDRGAGEIDMALVVRCAHGTYTFARGVVWDEMIDITADPDPAAEPALRPPERLWLQSADQRERNRVVRTVTAL